jgi:hypothetical protein
VVRRGWGRRRLSGGGKSSLPLPSRYSDCTLPQSAEMSALRFAYRFPIHLLHIQPELDQHTHRRQTPFQPSNRSTPLTLHHWRPLPAAPIIQGTAGNDKLKVEEKDPFEAFGREGNGPNVMSYSQVEYEAWLTGMSNCRVQMGRDEHFVGLRCLPSYWTAQTTNGPHTRPTTSFLCSRRTISGSSW